LKDITAQVESVSKAIDTATTYSSQYNLKIEGGLQKTERDIDIVPGLNKEPIWPLTTTTFLKHHYHLKFTLSTSQTTSCTT